MTITEYDPDKAARITNQKLGKEEQKQRYNNRINRLAASMANFPDSKLLNITLMNACIMNPENLNCSSNHIDKVLLLDGSNGALLSKIAALNAEKGDRDTAIDFLEKSANAPLFNDYRQERISLFINALKPSGLPLSDILVSAIGFEAAIWIGDLSVANNLCLSTPLQEDLVHTCIAYGKRLELDGSIMVLNSVGLQIQKLAYKQLADATSLEEIDYKRKLYEQILQDLINTEQLIHDENFISDWLTTIINYNEIESIRLMKKEAERLTLLTHPVLGIRYYSTTKQPNCVR